MPKVKEAAVAVSGIVLDIEHLKNFESKQPDGSRKVLVSTGDGFAQVKFRADDANVSVAFGEQVGWMVRFGAFARDGGGDAQATCGYVRPISEDDLDRLVSSARLAPAGK